MNDVIIYGIINEDREIVFISDYQAIDWDVDYWIEDDATWKIIKLDNKKLMDEVEEVDWERNIVILESVKIEEEKTKEVLDKWISVIKPKYVLDYVSPTEMADFIIRKEMEWEEEDRRLYSRWESGEKGEC